MILIDTSIWIDHIRKPNDDLGKLLMLGQAAQHPFVTAEVALGSLAKRTLVIERLQSLPQAIEVGQAALMAFIEEAKLAAKGIGFVDAHLLASTAGTAMARLWTRDKRLREVAAGLGIAYEKE